MTMRASLINNDVFCSANLSKYLLYHSKRLIILYIKQYNMLCVKLRSEILKNSVNFSSLVAEGFSTFDSAVLCIYVYIYFTWSTGHDIR